MYTRLFFGEIQQGKAEEAWQILNEFAQRVKQQKAQIEMREAQPNWAPRP